MKLKITVEVDVQDQYIKEYAGGFGLTEQGYNVLVSSVGSLGAIGAVGVVLPKREPQIPVQAEAPAPVETSAPAPVPAPAPVQTVEAPVLTPVKDGA